MDKLSIKKEVSQILLLVEKNSTDIKEIFRRLDNLERYSEQIYKDRELINENSESLAGLKQRVVDLGNHIENLVKDHTFEVSKQVEEVKDVVEDTGEQIAEDVIKGMGGDDKKKLGRF